MFEHLSKGDLELSGIFKELLDAGLEELELVLGIDKVWVDSLLGVSRLCGYPLRQTGHGLGESFPTHVYPTLLLLVEVLHPQWNTSMLARFFRKRKRVSVVR